MERIGRVKKKLTDHEKFTHRLCLALGEKDPEALLDRMSFKTYLKWLAYFNEEPWGEIRADMRNVVLMRYFHARGDEADMPSMMWPYWEDTSEEATLSKVQEIKDWIRENGSRFNRKTRRNPDSGHDSAQREHGPGAGDCPRVQ